MKTDFSPETQSPLSLLWQIVAHLFSPVFPFLSFLSCSLSSGVRQWPKPHGRFDQRYCSKAPDICPNGEEASFFQTPSYASCHLSAKQTCLCCKKMLKEAKNVFAWRKIEMWEEEDLGRSEKMQSSCLSVRHLWGVCEMLLFWIWTPLRDTVKSEIWIGTLLILVCFFSVSVSLAYVSTTEMLL